jgi:inhibitor of cysteine peptidase
MTTKRFVALVVIVVLAAGLFVVVATLPWDSSHGGYQRDRLTTFISVYGPGDSITASNGDRFTIALTANPTTGYSWSAEDNDDVQQVGSKQVAGSTMPGAGGTQMLTFEATAKGSTTLVLNYARPFEPDQPPAQTEKFPVTVR